MIVDEQLRHVPTARRASKARSAAARAASASRFCSASASFRARSASAARARVVARLAAPPLALGLVLALRGLAPRHGGPVALPLLVRLPDELALARASLDGLLALQRLAPRLARRARRLVALPRGAAWARGRAEVAGRRRRGRRGGRLLVLEPGHLVVGLGGARGALAESSAAAAGAAASGSARPGMSSSVSSSSDATWSKRE